MGSTAAAYTGSNLTKFVLGRKSTLFLGFDPLNWYYTITNLGHASCDEGLQERS